MQTIRHALQYAGWEEEDDLACVVIQRHRRGKAAPEIVVPLCGGWELDAPLGYDYAKKEDISTIARDNDYLYIQDNTDGEMSFVQVAIDITGEYRDGPSHRSLHALSCVIPVVGTPSWG